MVRCWSPSKIVCFFPDNLGRGQGSWRFESVTVDEAQAPAQKKKKEKKTQGI